MDSIAATLAKKTVPSNLVGIHSVFVQEQVLATARPEPVFICLDKDWLIPSTHHPEVERTSVRQLFNSQGMVLCHLRVTW